VDVFELFSTDPQLRFPKETPVEAEEGAEELF
jgi:hypothetical protein